MTQQQLELLSYRGRKWCLLGFPLSDCPDPVVKDKLSERYPRRSDLWRGYKGTWEIRSGRFWLIGLTMPERFGFEPRPLTWLFPKSNGPVLAEWFTGEVVSPRGKAERGGMFLLVWPWHRVFHVERGHVTGTELRDKRVEYRVRKDDGRNLRKWLDAL